jgi:fatty acid desaturase
MATIPARHRDKDDINSADDMRSLSPALMLVGAVVAILAIMAIVYSPLMWGIAPYGSDVTGTGEHAAVEKSVEH